MPRALVANTARRALAAGAIAASLVAASCSDDVATASATTNVSAPQPPSGSGFDFWVLALSWSPTYCEIEGEDANRRQCGSGRDLGFIVHGLWPQFAAGWPEYCESDEPERVPDSLVRDYLDIIPSAGLIGHQWRKHGSCSGLDQADYLATARAAWDKMTLPAAFSAPRTELRIDPDDVEAAFIEANAGLPQTGIAVSCDSGFIDEVRICLTRTLEFRSCAEVDARACKAASAKMPAPGD